MVENEGLITPLIYDQKYYYASLLNQLYEVFVYTCAAWNCSCTSI